MTNEDKVRRAANTMRYLMLSSVIFILLVWGGISIWNAKVMDLPQSLVGVIFVLVAGKSWEKYVESKGINPANPTPSPS